MYYMEDKVDELNKIFSNLLRNKRIAIWCIGIHTEKLLKYTDLLEYNIICHIDKNADNFANRNFFGKLVLKPSEVDFTEIDAIVVSTYKYQNAIVESLKDLKFHGEIVTCYSNGDKGEFFLLPSKFDKKTFFSGNYSTWDEACNNSIGYDESSIVEKVLAATKAVMEGKACYERDSVLFYEKSYNFHLVSMFGLLSNKTDKINILDWGGALGSEYWRNRELLYQLGTDFTWNVVEQENFVSIGNREVKNDELSFYSDVSQVNKKINIVLLSGVLQYLPDWKKAISKIIDLNADYILIERQVVSDESRICIEYVGESVYKASYPIRMISERKLLETIEGKYELITKFGSEVDPAIDYADGKAFWYKGFWFELK